jgi:hypothetical protein
MMVTNLINKGLISADRSNKATLPLTIPSLIKSFAKDFEPLIFVALECDGILGLACKQLVLFVFRE